MRDVGAPPRSSLGTAAPGRRGTPSEASLSVQRHARALRRHVRSFAVEVADRIRTEVPDCGGRPGACRRDDVVRAVERATHGFLDTIDGLTHRDREVGALFQALGRAAASEPAGLAAVHAALRLAATVAWDGMRRTTTGGPLPDATRGRLADGLFAYVDHLVDHAERGFAAGRAAIRTDDRQARAQLAVRLLRGECTEAVDGIDGQVWAPPPSVVVVVSATGASPDPGTSRLAADDLAVRHDGHLVVIAAADRADEVATRLADVGTSTAHSWPVAPPLIPSAHRWARRALDLVRLGVLPDQRITRCRDHRMQIWLHAEPALRQHLCQDVLAPLLAETPRSREVLAHTLLVWLETGDSSPAIASQLGVHAQTVRYRRRRIHELFGDDLRDPAFVAEATMLLRATVPLWRAGDRGDVERFRAEQRAGAAPRLRPAARRSGSC